jgi:hypothetical protein
MFFHVYAYVHTCILRAPYFTIREIDRETETKISHKIDDLETIAEFSPNEIFFWDTDFHFLLTIVTLCKPKVKSFERQP